jgi:hypothetical protein
LFFIVVVVYNRSRSLLSFANQSLDLFFKVENPEEKKKFRKGFKPSGPFVAWLENPSPVPLRRMEKPAPFRP